ncbi:MAG: Ig-like domain-containing protein [Muribaculaceae bacterium]|nr:Ig-like domain-containing protein [Muribaculaceae bacterium]
MKKILLYLVIVLMSAIGAHAETITFDFLNQTYGLPRENQASAPNLESGTTISNNGLELTFLKLSGYGFRLWTDGMRVYTGEVAFSFSGYQVTDVRIYNGTTLLASGQNTDNNYPWTCNWVISERKTITRMEVDVIVSSDVIFDFVNYSYGLTRESTPSAPYIEAGTVIYNNGLSITFDRQSGNGFRLWRDGLRVYKGECNLTINSPETIQSVEVFYNNGYEASFEIGQKVANITCTFAERGSIQKILVKVNKSFTNPVIPVSNITLNPSFVKGLPGESRQLTCSIFPANATNKSLMWISSDSSVATVDSAGTLRLISPGNCTITVLSTDGSGKYAICNVVVDTPQTPVISLNPSYYQGYPGTEIVLTPTVSPSNSVAGFIWSSSDNNVASVDGSGRVYLKKAGRCTITASSVTGNAIEGIATIEVLESKITSITLSPSVYQGKTGTTFLITPIIVPSGATNKTLLWSSMNPNIAMVNQMGYVTLISAGETLIIAESTDGSGVRASCRVTVIPDNASVNEIPMDAHVEIYDIAGLCIYSGVWDPHVWESLKPAVYIMNVNGDIRKVMR